MEVIIGEAPGGLPIIYECPTCSKAYLTCEVENGEPILNFRDEGGVKMQVLSVAPPTKCRRCGSPMDVKEAKDYGEKMATETANGRRAFGPRTIKV